MTGTGAIAMVPGPLNIDGDLEKDEDQDQDQEENQMATIKWSAIPKKIRSACWSNKCLPSDWDFDLDIFHIEVDPLYAALSMQDSQTGVSDFDSCNVYQDEVENSYTKKDLRYPIIVDRRFKGMQANVADGLHRIMLAHLLKVRTLPAIDVTDMFISAGYPIATNKC